MKKTIAVILTVLCLVSLALPAIAAGNVTFMSGVQEEMCRADYWTSKSKSADQVLMSASQIKAYNKAVVDAANTNRVDLLSVARKYDATALQTSLSKGIESEKPARDLYIDGKKLNKDSFYRELLSAVQSTGWKGTRSFRYAICTAHTGIYAIPCATQIGYSETDPDSEYQLSELRVNEPFLIKQTCTYQGKQYYWGLSDHLSGWVSAEALAICGDRQTWKDAFSVSAAGKDFIVVTTDQIFTELSRTVPAISGVRLVIGTVLKLVEKEKIPKSIGERSPWHNYVVYLPTRNADGSYQRKMALISQHCDVSVGFLPMTQTNLLNTAFKCLGNRYGWGGTLGAMDCSLYTRAVYLCCGINMPRNTTWQQNVPHTKFDLSKMTDAQKLKFLSRVPAGTLLYLPGHTMIFLGMDNKMGYVISNTGIVSAPDGPLQAESTYSVIINPLSARRRSGSTWLSNLTGAVIPAEFRGHQMKTTLTKATTKKDGKQVTACKFCGGDQKTVNIPAAKEIRISKSSYVYTGEAIRPKVSVRDKNGKAIAASNYTVKYQNHKNVGTATITVTFRGNYSGKLEKTFSIIPKGTEIKSVQAADNKLIATWSKQATQTIGYQIVYALDDAFKKEKRAVKITDLNETTAELPISAGGTYFVRIRTYARPDGKTLCSAWSNTISITVTSA